MHEPKVAVILVNWNGYMDTIDCITSIYNSEQANYKIIVVDNDSTDKSIQEIAKAFPEAHIIANTINSGFGSGNNLGVRWAKEDGAEFIWILNNDTKIYPDTICKLIEYSQKNRDISLIGNSIYKMDHEEEIQSYGCGKVDIWFGKAHLIRKIREISDMDYITGTSLFMQTDAFLELGGFDEEYFMYWEDTDLSYRARAQGLKLGIAVDAIILHKESSSSRVKSLRADIMFTTSSIKFFKQYSSNKTYRFGICFRIIKRILEKRFDNAWALMNLMLSSRTNR